MPRNPNPRSDFSYEFLLVINSTNQKQTFLFFDFSGVLMKLYYRLSMPKNPNPRSDFSYEFLLVINSTNQKQAFLFIDFSGVLMKL